ncbi:hypothetical protein EGM88_13620 [Aureibaculum marinum]|uniref:Uncharacterized protein n=1 Tax=Aureibaculum marinum TaxID=2487930 RepID=A0A3N4N9R5_9FLAO|nr:hypothetical protein [Aureibaculum marinum]RPD93084.1 hypothetical protein EGM88_13620 [Aureibaculum marinum]
MNLELKRHKLLGILSKQRNDLELKKAEYNALGVPFEKIYSELNCNEDELKLITSELYTADEIGYHDAYDIVGIFAKDNGLSSFANKKYSRIYWKRVSDLTKNAVQIIIPILSLLIAFIALSIKIESLNKSTDNKIDNLEKQVIELKSELDKTKNRIITKEIDTLSEK